MPLHDDTMPHLPTPREAVGLRLAAALKAATPEELQEAERAHTALRAGLEDVLMSLGPDVSSLPFNQAPERVRAACVLVASTLRQCLLERMVQRLNSALEADPEAVSALFAARFPCNEALAVHPTVQVRTVGGNRTVGPLDLLNGLLGTVARGKQEGWGHLERRMASPDSDRVLAFGLTETRPCVVCNQSQHDVGGEFLCAACGRPTLHDEPLA